MCGDAVAVGRRVSRSGGYLRIIDACSGDAPECCGEESELCIHKDYGLREPKTKGEISRTSYRDHRVETNHRAVGKGDDED
jgi:hypothetical protein